MSITSAATDTPKLDLAVKGSLPTPKTPPPNTPPPRPTTSRPPAPPSNPLDTAPSAPSQVYLNLLILEASLRSQYLHHLARRRKFTFFLILLFCWIAFFIHRIYILGGSPYYYISHLEWLGLLGGTITSALYYATGLYQKTIVEPRRFVSTANRGLRGFNIKLVKVPFSTREWIIWWWNWYTFHPPPQPPRRPPVRRPSSNSPKPRRLSTTRRPTPDHHHRHPPSIAMGRSTSLLTPHVEEATEEDPDDEVEEFLPGGLHLKIVILPKRFSANFREDWELYRTEYWERENESRATRRRDVNWRLWPRLKKDTPEPPPPPPPPPPAAQVRVRRGSVASERRPPSVSSRAGTPEPEMTPKRRESMAKKRPNMAPGLGRTGDVSDSGSTERRSETPEPEMTPKRRESMVKKRPNMAPGLGRTGDVSDSGSTERRSATPELEMSPKRRGSPAKRRPNMAPGLGRTGDVSDSGSVERRSETPEPEMTPKRRGSSVKRRPNMAPGLGRTGDVSDSGSTERRSESPVTDRSSSSAGTGKRKAGRGKGRGRKSVVGSGNG